MIEYVVLILAGCLIGVVTGLTPGLHVNTVCLIGLSVYPLLGLDPVKFSVAMVATSLTQNFIDFIPAIFTGVPEESTALSVLPTHKLVMQGRAMEAVKITAYGCFLGVILSVIFLLPGLYVIPKVYYWMRGFVVYPLLAAVVALIMRERRHGKLFALAAFVLSGILGLITLNMNLISSTHVLFPVFAGLFGLSNLLYSLKTEAAYVPQEKHVLVKIDRSIVGSCVAGTLGGIAVGLLPGLSPSQAGILMSSVYGGSTQQFLASISAINTSDTIYSLIALYTIDNPRSGVAVMIGRIIDVNVTTLAVFVSVICAVALLALLLQLYIGGEAMRVLERLNYRKLSVAVILVVLTLVYVMTGFLGVLIALVATSVGLVPVFAGVSRTHAMGVLILPTIIFFIGL